MTDLNWSELWDETEQRYRVQDRRGRAVRIYTLNGMDRNRPVVGEVRSSNGENWNARRWRRNGAWLAGDHMADLIPEPRTVRRWVNVYESPQADRFLGPGLYDTESKARQAIVSHKQHIATATVEWEE